MNNQLEGMSTQDLYDALLDYLEPITPWELVLELSGRIGLNGTQYTGTKEERIAVGLEKAWPSESK